VEGFQLSDIRQTSLARRGKLEIETRDAAESPSGPPVIFLSCGLTVEDVPQLLCI
jgi:hypothetical protein